MDNITHSLTGLMLSRAGLNRVSPQATWVLLLAANAPDIDIPSALGGSLNYLHYHRYLTHSLVALPLLALACVAVVRLFMRRPLNWKRAYFVALIGVASHLLLDLTNIYGVRLLLPFSSRWLRLDITSVVDPWIWAILLLALLGLVLGKLVQGEIGAPAAPPGRAIATFALLCLLLYDGSRYLIHERAIATLASRTYGGANPIRVAALPTLNPLRWKALVETADAYRIQELDLAAEFDPAAGRVFYKPERSPAIAAAERTDVVQEFLRFSQYPMWQTLPAEPEGATRVEVMDLRFCDPTLPRFVATTILDSRLDVVRAWFQFGAARSAH